MSDIRPADPVPETADLHVVRTLPLLPPRALKDELPAPRAVAEHVIRSRAAVRDIIAGRDSRLLVVVGPCSIHDPVAALEYAGRLAALRTRVQDRVYPVMRVYFEKPRTTVGWKGLINDPRLDGSYDIDAGLRIARRLLLDINGLGLPAATEMLDPVIPQYIADLVSWTAIGARTTESQTHREMASGLSMPVGFKNGTDGNLQIALDAMLAAGAPHAFLGIDQDGRSAIIQTTGNPDRHIVLRGGGGRTNYEAAFVEQAAELLRKAGLRPSLMVDCSHANSSKDYTRQVVVLRDLLQQIRGGSRAIMGVMLESHLHAGNQRLEADPTALRYGVSITDPCMDWETTETVLLETYDAQRGATAA